MKLAVGLLIVVLLSFISCIIVSNNYQSDLNLSKSEFMYSPKDLPILLKLDQIYEYRKFGSTIIEFDGEFVTIENLPDDYISYSATYDRLP